MIIENNDTIKVIISNEDDETIGAAIVEMNDTNLMRIIQSKWGMLKGFKMRPATDNEWDTLVDAFNALPIVDIDDYMEPLDDPE